MKVEVEFDEDDVVKKAMKEAIELAQRFLDGTNKEDRKEAKKDIKAFKRVHNYYSGPADKI